MPAIVIIFLVCLAIGWVSPALLKYAILGPLLGLAIGGLAWGFTFPFVDNAWWLLSFKVFGLYVLGAIVLVEGTILMGDVRKP